MSKRKYQSFDTTPNIAHAPQLVPSGQTLKRWNSNEEAEPANKRVRMNTPARPNKRKLGDSDAILPAPDMLHGSRFQNDNSLEDAPTRKKVKIHASTRVNETGQLLYFNSEMQQEYLAVTHESISPFLIQAAASKGSYTIERHAGKGLNDVTAYHEDYEKVTAERSSWPDVLCRIKPEPRDLQPKEKKIWRVNGYVVLDHDGQAMLRRPSMPVTISPEVEAYLMELFWRLEPDMSWSELQARAPKGSFNHKGRLGVLNRFRKAQGILSWNSNHESWRLEAFLNLHVGTEGLQGNSIRNVGKLEDFELDEINIATSGSSASKGRGSNKVKVEATEADRKATDVKVDLIAAYRTKYSKLPMVVRQDFDLLQQHRPEYLQDLTNAGFHDGFVIAADPNALEGIQKRSTQKYNQYVDEAFKAAQFSDDSLNVDLGLANRGHEVSLNTPHVAEQTQNHRLPIQLATEASSTEIILRGTLSSTQPSNQGVFQREAQDQTSPPDDEDAIGDIDEDYLLWHSNQEFVAPLEQSGIGTEPEGIVDVDGPQRTSFAVPTAENEGNIAEPSFDEVLAYICQTNQQDYDFGDAFWADFNNPMVNGNFDGQANLHHSLSGSGVEAGRAERQGFAPHAPQNSLSSHAAQRSKPLAQQTHEHYACNLNGNENSKDTEQRVLDESDFLLEQDLEAGWEAAGGQYEQHEDHSDIDSIFGEHLLTETETAAEQDDQNNFAATDADVLVVPATDLARAKDNAVEGTRNPESQRESGTNISSSQVHYVQPHANSISLARTQNHGLSASNETRSEQMTSESSATASRRTSANITECSFTTAQTPASEIIEPAGQHETALSKQERKAKFMDLLKHTAYLDNHERMQMLNFAYSMFSGN